MNRKRAHLDTLLDIVDMLAKRTTLLSINEAVKTAQAELAGRDITIAIDRINIS